MNLSKAYLLLAAVGLAVPWYFNIAYLQGGGSFAPGPFAAAVSANPLVTGITWDVYIAAVAASLWMVQDARKHRIGGGWLHVLACFAIGLAFSLPLYLARRERSRPAA